MGDLSYHTSWWCSQNEHFEMTVPGSKDDEYVVVWDNRMGWSCTCPGFKFRKDCKHIALAEKERCTFGEGAAWGSPEPDDAFVKTKDGRVLCPKCKEPARGVTWAA